MNVPQCENRTIPEDSATVRAQLLPSTPGRVGALGPQPEPLGWFERTQVAWANGYPHFGLTVISDLNWRAVSYFSN